ncbi:hypothetical protein TIFTF001_011063 [Ficus carica]|uniref:Rrn7/TAF1B C-terminal cyclin domain-containing protein n=1 Tax=Ficus carica TaxID=3494 RepID=A0AA87ZR17_FICCA|nr:hypothetical protein TIFTF001_011063 [Ficus carica]
MLASCETPLRLTSQLRRKQSVLEQSDSIPAKIIELPITLACRNDNDGGSPTQKETLDMRNLREQGVEREPPQDFKRRAKYSSEPHNMYGQRAVMIWFRALRKKIPLSYTLGVSFLVCHLAREAVLTTDIVKWSVEGKLPYFAAFVEIEKRIGQPPSACPISTSVMFRPNESVTAQKLESISASISDSVGLALPPVNFYAIASRYLRELSLPLEKIRPHACRIYEWSMPPDLWLSTNELRLPTRVCVMSILIVAIRILYNLNGFGVWEKSLSTHQTCSTSSGTEESELKQDPDVKKDPGKDSGSPQSVDDIGTNPDRDTSHAQKTELDAAELLCNLEARYNGINKKYGKFLFLHSKDLPTYLQFCKDVVFAGLEPSFEDYEEKRLIDELWDFYQNERDSKTEVEEEAHGSGTVDQKRARVDVECSRTWPRRENKKFRDKGCIGDLSSSWSARDRRGENSDQFDSSQDEQSSEQKDQASADTLKDETAEILKDEAIRLLKSDMEENRFYYIPPRVNPKRFDYLHYVRKRDEGALTYVAHADYYILLRACAKVAKIEIRLLHIGVLSFERRLTWMEHRINHCLHMKPPTFFCEFCSYLGNASVESLGLSNLNI